MPNLAWTTKTRGEAARLLPLCFARSLAHFGPQHWWPGETREEVIIGAVLTQNTSWTNVERALDNLRREIPITLRAVTEISPDHLARHIRPAGYFTLKTKRLQSVARWFVERCDPVRKGRHETIKTGKGAGATRKVGEKTVSPGGPTVVGENASLGQTSEVRLSKGPFALNRPDVDTATQANDLLVPPRRVFHETGQSVDLSPMIGLKGAALEAFRQEILTIHGVGPETADSILLYALDGETFVVDAYTMRVGQRHGLFPPGASYEEVKLIFEGILGRDADLFNEYHAQLVALGKYYCKTRNPLCGQCPLGHDECFAFGQWRI